MCEFLFSHNSSLKWGLSPPGLLAEVADREALTEDVIDNTEDVALRIRMQILICLTLRVCDMSKHLIFPLDCYLVHDVPFIICATLLFRIKAILPYIWGRCPVLRGACPTPTPPFFK